MKLYVAPVAIAVALALTACNGSSSSSPFFPGGSSYVRIVNGSPDAGAIDVQVDGAAIQTALAYGTMSAYTSVKIGSHTMNVFRAGHDTGKPISSTSFSVNGGQDTTIVLAGERHPAYGTKRTIGLRVFTEQPYSTPSGGAAVNFHNAAPIALNALHLPQVQFGFSINSAPAKNNLGTAQSYGGATGPQGLPSSALNTPVTLYAKSPRRYTITPGDAMSGCTGLPCNGQSNLSLYFIDGPAASRTPPTSYPPYFSPKSKADFVGVFDGNGLIQ